MSGYMTKKEATEYLGKSVAYVDRAIASEKIAVVTDPNDGRKKLLLTSDVHKVKEEKENTKAEKDPQFLQDLAVKEIKLDLLDVVDPYKVPVQALHLYEEEVQAVAKLSADERKDAFEDLVHKIVEKHRENSKEASNE